MTNEDSVAQYDDRLDYLEKLIEERDLRYDARFIATEKLVASDIKALRDTTTIVVSTFREAMAKAEQAQDTWNVLHNDLVRKMENQYQQMMPREEALGKFEDIKQCIANLRESRSAAEGKSGGLHAGWAYLMGGVVLLATVTHLVLSLVQATSK